MEMNFASVIVLLLIAACLAFAVFTLIKHRNDGCGSCSCCSKCQKKKKKKQGERKS